MSWCLRVLVLNLYLRIGSRGSQLALWQANWVKSRLVGGGHTVEIEIIKTTGDKVTDVPLAAAGGTKGLFIKEIEEALLEGRVHLAVHSLKDVPAELPAGLELVAIPEREDPRDAYVSRDGRPLDALAADARVGTSSLRRAAQLRHRRPDLAVEALRGNVDTRLRRLDEGRCDAIVLAAAGLVRLGWQARITAYFSVEEMCPAIGQGALAIEARSEDSATRRALEPLEHRPTRLAVTAERALLARLGGGCQVPVAAFAELRENALHLRALVASPDGRRLLRAEGPGDEPVALGHRVAEQLLAQGAEEILKEVYRR